ncbi:hypothetical protein BXA19_11590 [Corynebacterium diphtheriae]|nr:hypothetical protein BUE67_11530 [Corynebacterium diphtheriae]OLO13482.1 hypothetical protein BUV99_11445 [Corynebacterium diphtheriae]OLO21087.1 hypothetical protein BVH76_11325 [Corynebacterium diphtheriae]OLO21475.1 hypothetical protein BVH78_10555 [Corynebacterium diphtheriae]OMO43388.1 hypothetical protein BVL41_10770 [Corynebacterium diphtheriae]
MCTRPSPSALKSAAVRIVLALLIGYIEVVRQGIQSSSTNRNYLTALIVVAIIMVADWHDPTQ